MLLSAAPPSGPRPAKEVRLREEAARHRDLTPPRTHPSASITWLGPAASNPALAYRVTGDRAHLDESRWIEAAVRLPHWGRAHMPDHDLDAGWLLHHLSLAHRWVGDELPDGVRALLRYKLLLQGRRMHEFAVASEGRWWSSSYWQNHNWICYAGLATAGYVLGKEEWTERARDNLGTVLDLMPADGSHAEGVVYWRYGVPFLAIHLDLLKEAEGVDWWERGGFLANTFRYRLHQTAPGFAFNVDHGDCHDRRSGHSAGLYYRLAAQYGIAEAQWMGDLASGELLWQEAAESGVRPGILPEAYLEYLWYDPSVPAARPTETRAYFPDLGLLAARTGWDDDATLVSFKASPGGGHTAWETSARHRAELGWETLNQGHHHPDSGSFVLISQGAFLAVDEGYSNRKRAAHHNLLLVDGQGYADEGRYHVYQDIPYERQARQRDVLVDTEYRLGARHGGDRRDVRPCAGRPAPGPDPGVHAVGAARAARPGRGGGGTGVDVPAPDRPSDGAAAGRRPTDQVGSGHRPRTAVRTSRRLGHLRGHRGRGQSDVQYAGPASHADAPHTPFDRPAVVGRSLPHRHHARGRVGRMNGSRARRDTASRSRRPGRASCCPPSPGGSVRPG